MGRVHYPATSGLSLCFSVINYFICLAVVSAGIRQIGCNSAIVYLVIGFFTRYRFFDPENWCKILRPELTSSSDAGSSLTKGLFQNNNIVIAELW